MRQRFKIEIWMLLAGVVFGFTAAEADSISFTDTDFPESAEVVAAPVAGASFGDDADISLAQTFTVTSAFSAGAIYLAYETDSGGGTADWSMTVRIFEVADVSAATLVAVSTNYSGTFTFQNVGGTDSIARIDLTTPVFLTNSVGTSGYAVQITEENEGDFNPGFEWLRTTSVLNDVYAGGAGYENGTLKGTGTDARDFALAIAPTVEPGTTGTLTVKATKDLSNPDIIAYNLGHFHEDSNSHDWWRYSGVNGARMFISPATLESSDDIAGWGDGVTDLAGFLARKDLLRADPLNESYINWTYFNDRYENKLFGTSSSGNRFTVNHAVGKLHELGIDVLVQATAKESHLPITGSSDWAGKWELWQHYYAQAFYLGRHFDVHRFQMFNEPNHGNADGLTPANWLMRLQLASDAIQSAIADVNSMYGKSLEPLVYGPVTTSGADYYNGTGWGDYMVENRHVNFLGETNEDYYVVHRYDYHEYNESAANFGSHLSGLRSALNADMPEGRFPISISEFNVHTASTFDGLTKTIDSPSKYSRLGAIGVNLANQYCKELYCFKFGQVTKDGPNYPVGKNGMHYVQNSGAPYDYGGSTRAAEVWRLFAKALKAGGEQKDFYRPADGSLDGLEIRATHVPETGNYYVYSSSELAGGSTPLTIDTSAWNIPAGSRFLLEEVSETRYGTGREWGTVSADGTLFDGADNVMVQPEETVWLFTIPEGPLEDELVIDAVEDATVADGVNSGSNYGANTTLRVRNDSETPDGRSASFIKFNLPLFYPPDIHMAVLEVTGKSDTNDLTQAHVYGLDDDSWSASSLTWDNAPNLLKGAATGNLITNRVVDGQGESAYIQGQLVFPNESNKERFIDVTDFLKSQPGRDVSFMITQDPRWDVTLPSLEVGDTQLGGQTIQSMESGSGPQLKIVLKKDSDSDGISDEAETETFGTNPALADTDGDGQTDGEEIFAGSDPNDPDSSFVIPVVETLANGSFRIEWPSLEDRAYGLERTSTLLPADWDEIYTAIGTGSIMEYIDSTTTNAYYRLQIQ
ncbi:DNRLRE domain-containing protein [Pontiellaceae bacterium B12227]|nr:DNRLRE domain-containing protein [Pontiellaceae bacterium B12227]